ncbi:MAG: CPBP family intramembrane metalloprotease [Gammaproteobacteria bacterium]|nr:CPBP family intramembrane metalloprotease [Gammaproteobacteria bacterium]NNC97635.1 CPBP family intramembrane metalloprotease [Gammaproteobacteria bacterium]NNM14179.1 CPBP family intramembrane metalloprotease [Gammaproteobacteria bacterium]
MLQLKPLRLFALFVAGVFLFPFVMQLLFNLLYGNELLGGVSTNVEAVCMLIGYLLAYTATVVYARDYFRFTLSNFFSKVSFRILFLSFLAGLLFTAAIVEVMILIEPPQDFGESTGEYLNGTVLSRAVLILFTALLGPLVEEFVFRAYIFDALKQKYTFATTALISSALFTLPHMPEYYSYWPAGLIIFSLGLLLAYFRKRHDSLLPCIVLHATYNSGLLLLFFIASA